MSCQICSEADDEVAGRFKMPKPCVITRRSPSNFERRQGDLGDSRFDVDRAGRPFRPCARRAVAGIFPNPITSGQEASFPETSETTGCWGHDLVGVPKETKAKVTRELRKGDAHLAWNEGWCAWPQPGTRAGVGSNAVC